ncbi:hypothetical protein ASE74_03615 [Pedobacter sp. Leaf216]|uniref:DUF5672 family protein n=1 Tax=Pedobacter sp. Leaf216 TaxID=1735684 RepID=UPI0006FC8823|nr:DUF5672 family protein [Pedobacter sp. Leaf216]KQM75073.1 hypothetical protein ASE74_03615 [Pedobacter sp. Leaf216]
MKKVAVIIPIYQEISYLEDISLKQCFKVLSKSYPIFFVKPTSLNLNTNYPFTSIISFDDAYFKDIAGYNKLMLSGEFYKTFLDYEYILIHQLDAFIFKDDLNIWCEKNIDYVGAPWLRHKYPDVIKAVKNSILGYIHRKFDLRKKVTLEPTDIQREYKVGNGGLSLRRTQKFHQLTEHFHNKIIEYTDNQATNFNEDVFWSIEVNRKKKYLNIPSYKEAVFFAFEVPVDRAFELTNNVLPFGCHAWNKNLEVWGPIFKEFGYSI